MAVSTKSQESTKPQEIGFVKNEELLNKLTPMQELHNKITAILIKYDYKETEIPLDNEYWSLLNQYRGMRND